MAAEGDAPVQMRVHKSLKLWSFYVDLEESLGTLDDTRKVYERILDLKIATPQIILNYTALLEVPLPSLANVANTLVHSELFSVPPSTYLFLLALCSIRFEQSGDQYIVDFCQHSG